MKIIFSSNALNAFQSVKLAEPEKAERIKNILKDAVQHPEFGLGEPVALEGKYKGLWQRNCLPIELCYPLGYRHVMEIILMNPPVSRDSGGFWFSSFAIGCYID